MNAETDFLTNARFVACSRRNDDVDIARRTFLLMLIFEFIPPEGGSYKSVSAEA